MTATPTIPNMWPEDIQVNALSPLVILKLQAEGLRERTKGVLEAEVTTTKGAEDFEIHRLQVVARQFGSSRHGIVSVTHRAEFYPAIVEAKVFRFRAIERKELLPSFDYSIAHLDGLRAGTAVIWPPPGDWRPVAASQNELISLLGQVFMSVPVRALIEDLLARSYEVKLAAETVAQPAA